MKNKNRLWAKALASVAVSGVLLSGLTVLGSSVSGPLITKASAGVDGGGSTGGGGGGAGGAGRWVEIPKSKLDNGSIQNIPAQYRDSPICRNAIAYFGIVPNVVSDTNATGGSWTYSFYGVGTGNGVNFPGGSNVATRIADNVGWSYQQGADYLYQKNFICLDDPNKVTSNEWRYEVRTVSASDDSLNMNEPYSYTTQVSPQSIEGVDADGRPKSMPDPIGANNLNRQSADQKTNYGKVWDQYKSAVDARGADTKNIVAQFKAKFDQAKAADAEIARASVNLNEGNQAGLAEGGILNINEYTKKARASVSTRSVNFQVWRCGWDHWSKSGWQATGCQAVGGSIDPNNLPQAGKDFARWDSDAQRRRYTPTSSGQTSWTQFATTIQPSTETQQQTGFWQILAAHCNAQGIVDLKKAMGSDLVSLSSGDSSSEISGLLRTKFYPSQPSVLPLGSNSASLPAAQRATASLGFYDKECPFDCTPDRSGAGASAENGAESNVAEDNRLAQDGKTELDKKGLFGAKSSDSVNSSYAEMFRDNTERTMRPDVWYPVSTKGVAYAGEEPKTTLVTRWANGTPTLGTEFQASKVVKDAEGKVVSKAPLFDVTKKTQDNQKNFDVAEEFSTATAGQVKGLLDTITVQSTWASDSEKPQALQVAWEYAPSVSSNVPASLSFNPGGGQLSYGSFIQRSTKIDGRCWAAYGTTESTPAKSELNANTGTGAATNFTVPNGDVKNARNLILNFVRGTSE